MKTSTFQNCFVVALLSLATLSSCKHAEVDENASGTEQISTPKPATNPTDSVQDVGSSTDSTSVDRVPEGSKNK